MPVLQINNKNNALFDLMSFDFGLEVETGLKLSVPFRVLAQSEGYHEHWLTESRVVIKKEKTFFQWQSDDFLTLLFEANVDNNRNNDISEATYGVYHQALKQAESQGYSELIRTWNYFPRINTEEAGLERYQSFCVARQDALNQFPLFQKQNPAATAIGTHKEVNNFVFLFAKTKGDSIENKRQLPAWEYPQRYAPKRPRFARAMCHSGVLMCSGTASVVGHETKHVGDLEKQFQESLMNIKALLQQCDDELQLSEGFYRFYLRDESSTKKVVKLLLAAGIRHYVILAADVCRANLLIECEAVFQK